MSKKNKSAISPTREQDYSAWYQEVVKASDMAENSPVRGCMVIKPWGYALWENIVHRMDIMFKETGVKKCLFPLVYSFKLSGERGRACGRVCKRVCSCNPSQA